MTKEERKEYAREYRREGFGRLSDRRYYLQHMEELRAKARERIRRLRNAKKHTKSD